MCDAYSSSIRTPRQEGLEPAPASAVRRGGQQSGLRIAMPENVSLLKRSVRPYARGGRGVHGRKQHDGKEADKRRVAAAATVRVGDRRERLDAVHCRVPPYRCSEAARVIPKDENPEKPYCHDAGGSAFPCAFAPHLPNPLLSLWEKGAFGHHDS